MTTPQRMRRKDADRPEVQKVETATVTVLTSAYGVEKEKRQEILVDKFVTEPAYIRVNAGKTMNLGNYESFRVDVSITMPCYAEEVDAVQIRVANSVSKMLEEELIAYGVLSDKDDEK